MPIIYQELAVTTEDWYFIKDINCLRIDRSIQDSSLSIWSIMIQNWSDFLITWCWGTGNAKILQFTAWYRNFEHIVEINTLNWLIETKKVP